MIGGGSLKQFLARYFPVFMGTILLGCFSGSTLLVLAGTTYWRALEPSARTDYIGLGTLALVLVLVLGNLLIVRGRAWAVWWVAGYFLACLAAVVPMLAYRPHQGVYLFAVLLPLLGLLLLNSKRHREMRKKLVEIRRQRSLITQAAKAPRSRR
ncbi:MULTISPECIES: hypothetical protein [Pseudomonas]|jgi:hypothetical protein|uniref:Uncharacterized protein n=1 Tax=Pseudomonas bijieensis TaxID=2681983 RepID=A0A6N1CNU6_9PSED|nr:MULTISPECIES: hypothetical protein [Pseudomonas]MCD9117799.1 hypothetical protein [Pseudomonas bijieensis]PWJ40614.1 hypothetical protein ATJ40_102392 [Pseudomonas sp. 43mfcvi1.1]QKS83223.1 hypothetical protein GN234_15245 [Pseudomonas bijieensis]UQI31767.1 hypothetical protein M3M50_03850 [Pseudomonas bijieensis]WLH63559.1 hypothetical protein PSH86_03075 [Pseudomonas sp. FP2300]